MVTFQVIETHTHTVLDETGPSSTMKHDNISSTSEVPDMDKIPMDEAGMQI